MVALVASCDRHALSAKAWNALCFIIYLKLKLRDSCYQLTADDISLALRKPLDELYDGFTDAQTK